MWYAWDSEIDAIACYQVLLCLRFSHFTVVGFSRIRVRWILTTMLRIRRKCNTRKPWGLIYLASRVLCDHFSCIPLIHEYQIAVQCAVKEYIACMSSSDRIALHWDLSQASNCTQKTVLYTELSKCVCARCFSGLYPDLLWRTSGSRL